MMPNAEECLVGESACAGDLSIAPRQEPCERRLRSMRASIKRERKQQRLALQAHLFFHRSSKEHMI
jgi:hypothetical protein